MTNNQIETLKDVYGVSYIPDMGKDCDYTEGKGNLGVFKGGENSI